MSNKYHEIAKIFFDVSKFTFTIGMIGYGFKDNFDPRLAGLSVLVGFGALLLGKRMHEIGDEDGQ